MVRVTGREDSFHHMSALCTARTAAALGTLPELFTALVGKIKEIDNNYKHIYTDGSKMDEKVAAAAVTDSEIFVSRLADQFLQLRLEQSI